MQKENLNTWTNNFPLWLGNIWLGFFFSHLETHLCTLQQSAEVICYWQAYHTKWKRACSHVNTWSTRAQPAKVITVASVCYFQTWTFYCVLKHTIKITFLKITKKLLSFQRTLHNLVYIEHWLSKCLWKFPVAVYFTTVCYGTKLPHSLHVRTPTHLCVLLLCSTPLTSVTDVSSKLASLPYFPFSSPL